MARAKQPVSINDLEFDALISEDRTLEATVPQYSVETGFPVSDAIILSPESVSMTLYVTNTPVTWYNRHGANMSRVNQVVKRLEEMYYNAEPVTVVTTDATYTNMAIESLTLSKTVEAGYAREIPITFKKIRITYATTTSIPSSYGKSGATGASAGTANTTTGSSNGSSSGGSSSGSSGSGAGSGSSQDDNKGSVLYNAASSLGLFD